MNLSGLSATYPGYMAAEDQTAKTAINQTKQRDAAIKLLGANVAGAALAGGNSPGPQAPAPGQSSVPNAPAPPTAIPPSAAGGGAPQSKMGLGQAVQQVLRTAPGVANHPEILLSALTHFNDLGLLDPEAQAKVVEASKMHTAGRIAAAKDHLKTVTETPAFPVGGTAPVTPSPAVGSASMPTATDPKTGAKVQWTGAAWQPMPS